MNKKETLDAFFRAFAHAFVLRAAEGFRDFGRGLLLIGFADPGTGPMGPGWCQYVPLATLARYGYSADVLATVREFDPDRECVLLLNVGADQAPLLLKMGLERGAGQAYADN